MGYKLEDKGWQTLWIRYATDLDVKNPETKGSESRYYKYAQNQRKHQPGFQKRGGIHK